MPAYIVVHVDIHDPDRYEIYKAMAPPSVVDPYCEIESELGSVVR